MTPRLIPKGSRPLADFIADHGHAAADALPSSRIISWNHIFFVLPAPETPNDNNRV